MKTDRDFDGWTTTTYCEVCEISDGNKGVLGWKKCDRRYEIPTNCTLIPQPLTDEHDHPAWVFTSYDVMITLFVTAELPLSTIQERSFHIREQVGMIFLIRGI